MTGRATSPQGRRSDEEARATRARLLQLAGELFAERGYAQTSLRDLARRAGVTSGAIYGHFRNKAGLLAETVHDGTERLLEADAMGVATDRDHVETLTRQGARIGRRRRLRALIVQGAAAAQTDADTREQLREEQRRHIEAWAEGFRRHRARLGIDQDVDVDTAILYVWAAELGLGVLESVGIEPRSAKAWAEVQRRVARSWRLDSDSERPGERGRVTTPPAGR